MPFTFEGIEPSQKGKKCTKQSRFSSHSVMVMDGTKPSHLMGITFQQEQFMQVTLERI